MKQINDNGLKCLVIRIGIISVSEDECSNPVKTLQGLLEFFLSMGEAIWVAGVLFNVTCHLFHNYSYPNFF